MQKQKLIVFLLSLVLLSCQGSGSKSSYTNEAAPENFTARFETTQGNFEVEVTKAWSPAAADRFYNLVKSGFYDNTLFYRVVPNFVAQFGSLDPHIIRQWIDNKVPDEPVLHGNKRGTITFARSGKESRGMDAFINLKNNVELDTMDYNGVKGFPAFGEVKSGMDVVEKLYGDYGETTMENEYLSKSQHRMAGAFPKLDRIIKASVTSEK